jgi:hypothetical protein
VEGGRVDIAGMGKNGKVTTPKHHFSIIYFFSLDFFLSLYLIPLFSSCVCYSLVIECMVLFLALSLLLCFIFYFKIL